MEEYFNNLRATCQEKSQRSDIISPRHMPQDTEHLDENDSFVKAVAISAPVRQNLADIREPKVDPNGNALSSVSGQEEIVGVTT